MNAGRKPASGCRPATVTQQQIPPDPVAGRLAVEDRASVRSIASTTSHATRALGMADLQAFSIFRMSTGAMAENSVPFSAQSTATARLRAPRARGHKHGSRVPSGGPV